MIRNAKELDKYIEACDSSFQCDSLVYWRICKVGSTSLIGSMREMNDGKSTLVTGHELTSSKINIISEDASIPEDEFSKIRCFNFIVVRNPYHRFLSGFNFCKYGNASMAKDFKSQYGDIDPEDFLRLDPKEVKAHHHNIFAHSLKRMVDYVPNCIVIDMVLDSTMVDNALPSLAMLFGKIRGKKAKVPGTRRERVSNVSDEEYRTLYEKSDDLKELVQDRFKEDFEAFDFYGWSL